MIINKQFKIIKKLGSGRSQIFLAENLGNLNSLIALKILPPEADNEEILAFVDEYSILKNLTDKNIVKCYDFGNIVHVEDIGSKIPIKSNSLFFTMDFIDGINIFEYCLNKSESEIIFILSRLCKTLFYLHQSNYIYSDLKAENILISGNENPGLFLIDFGLCCNTKSAASFTKRGTAEYLAPEVLTGGTIDHRSDIYSLGVLIYKIIYRKFPFEKKDQLELFKAHINSEPVFPKTNFPSRVINAVKKMLAKDPAERFSNAMEILTELNIDIEKSYFSEWIPPKVFVVTEIISYLIKNYLFKKNTNFLVLLNSPEGSGKSRLVEEVYLNFEKIILINNGYSETGKTIWEQTLKRIYNSNFILNAVSQEIKDLIENVLCGNTKNLANDLKSIFNHISAKENFTIIFDDFNLYDEISISILLEIIPVFLVNKIKIIVTENSSYNSFGPYFHSKIVKQLNPFSENEIHNFLNKTFSPDFPIDDIYHAIIAYSNLRPGRIFHFLSALFFFGMINYRNGQIIFEPDKTILESLKEDNFHFSAAQFAGLDDEDKATSIILSAAETNLRPQWLNKILSLTPSETGKSIKKLIEKNILRQTEKAGIKFVSQNLKDYIYSQIPDKPALHLKLAAIMEQIKQNISRLEISRQYFLGGDFINAGRLIYEEIDDPVYAFTFRYRLSLLDKLLGMPLDSDLVYKIKFDKAITLFNLDDKPGCILQINDCLNYPYSEKDILTIKKLKASCLISLGETDEARNILDELLLEGDENFINDILIEKAVLEFECSKFKDAEYLIDSLLAKNLSGYNRARLLNLKAIIYYSFYKNIDKAVLFFKNSMELYKQQNELLKYVQIKQNIGTQYFLQNNFDLALAEWTEAYKINNEIGNLDQDGLLNSNFGVFHRSKFEIDRSKKHFRNAESVFEITGNKKRLGIVKHNHLILNIDICEYKSALKQIEQCRNIFSSLNEKNELAELYFTEIKLYSAIGLTKRLLFASEIYKELASAGNLPQYHENNLALTGILEDFYNEIKIDKNKVLDLCKKYFSSDTVSEFIYILRFLYINLKETDDMFFYECTENPIVKEHCKVNFLDNIRINYIKSEIMSSKQNYSEALSLLENGYQKLIENNINEFTWKYTHRLAEEYLRRGNKNQAYEYIKLTRSLISHISEQFSEYDDKSAYLNEKERASVSAQAKTWEKYFYGH